MRLLAGRKLPDASLPFELRTILVPVVNGPQSLEAAHLAARLAGKRARVFLLRVVVVDPELPLEAHLTDQLEAAETLCGESAAVVGSYGVKVERVVVRARLAGRAIVEQAARHSADMVILGAPRSAHRQIFGHTVQYVLRHSPARVMVAAGKRRWLPFDEREAPPVELGLKRILVPTKLGPIGEEMLGTAVKLAAGRNVSVDALNAILVPLEHAIDDELPEQEERAAASLAEARLVGERHGVPVDGTILRTRSIGKAIVERAAEIDADLIVLGSAPRWRRQSRFFSPTVDYVLRRASAEVLIVAFPQSAIDGDLAATRHAALGWASR